MKKIIAATAGLLLVGSMASVASADVTFTGNTRARLALMENYGNNNTHDDYFNNRFRLMIHATTKGGAYADARLWMGTTTGQADGNGTTDSGIFTDWSYVGIPMGPVTLRAGKMPDFSSVFFFFDQRVDGVDATWANKMTSVTAAYYKRLDANGADSFGFAGGNHGLWAANSETSNDINWFAVQLNQKFAGDWKMMFYGIYQDDQANNGYTSPTTGRTSQADGFLGTARVQGTAGPVQLLGELSYKDGDVQQTKDNGWGGIVHAKVGFGPASMTGVLGFTKNGFAPDSNYGFLMMGQAMGGGNTYLADIGAVGSPIEVMPLGRLYNTANGDGKADGNTWFTGLVGDYKINKSIKLVGILAYDDVQDIGKFVEVSGLVRFDVVEGAYVDLGAGYLHKSWDNNVTAAWDNTHDDGAFGVFSEIGISF